MYSLFKKLFSKKVREVSNEQELFVFDYKDVLPRLFEVSFTLSENDKYTDIVFDVDNKEAPVLKPFMQDISVGYGIDTDNEYKILQNKHLSETLSIEALHHIALENFSASFLNNTRVEGSFDDVIMLINDGNNEAAMILLDLYWDELAEMFKNDICICIPQKDLIFVTAKNNEAGLSKMRELIKSVFSEIGTGGKLVKHIYERQKAGWYIKETINV
ncbi:hypothetical protein [Polluticaenibacter yanchengensis]|uniref:DUF1444 family protein n=1 Tax=Polluticaenibacter yanchengensis TaxID=3014562 RepID=A0ABT4UNI5_9BACT|nr:DUF1444 family protein [Chitinophagaceae bacterium LY-5]